MKPVLFSYSLMAILAAQVAATPRIVHVADAQFRIGEGIPAGQTPQGVFVYIPVLAGTFNTTSEAPTGSGAVSTPLCGRVVPGGSDYAQVRTDGSLAPSVSAGFVGLNDPSFFRFTAYGYVEPGLVPSGNMSTRYGDIDAYQVIRINTNSTRYAWLNAAALVAQESLDIVNGVVVTVNLRIFRILVKERV